MNPPLVSQVIALNAETPPLVRHWMQFIQATEGVYARIAEQRGEPHTPLGHEDLLAAARLAAELGVTPTGVAASMPAGSSM
jgi:hypothetical protein